MNKKLNYNINILNKNCITTWLYPKSSRSIFLLGKLQLTHMWFGRNLSCLSVVWNLTLYRLDVWSKFKLLTYGLKSHDTSVLLDLFYFIWSCVFMFFVFLNKRDIKME